MNWRFTCVSLLFLIATTIAGIVGHRLGSRRGQQEAASQVQELQTALLTKEERVLERERALITCQADLSQAIVRERESATRLEELSRQLEAANEVLRTPPEPPVPIQSVRERLRSGLAELFAHEGGSLADLRLEELASNSPDPAVRAAGLRFLLEIVDTAEDRRRLAEFRLETGQLDAATAAAAHELAAHWDEELQAQVELRCEQATHPMEWGWAVALAKAGDRSALDRWAKRAIEGLAGGTGDAKGVVAAALYSPLDHGDRAAIWSIAADSESPRIRAAAVPLILKDGRTDAIERLRTLSSSDSDAQVRAVAALALASWERDTAGGGR